jgi:mannose-6-phosphate isomerase-like protein (cupin superfamily)|nr:AraC family ligand binding domain-containing protein [uncultured Limnohabitans sp.]
MNLPSFDEFRQKALAAGFDEVIEREWAPNTVLETHAHPFGVHAIVTRGEMWLTMNGHTQHLQPGAIFELEPNVPHDERYGAQGAIYWVARKNV